MRTAIMSFATCSPRRTPASIALGDDVGQAVVDGDLHLDVRVVRQKLVEGGPEDRIGCVLTCRDADRARRLLPQFA